MTARILLIVLLGLVLIVFLLVAIQFSRAWLADPRREHSLVIRQLAEHSAALFFAGPMALAVWEGPENTAAVAALAVALGIVTVAAGQFIRVATLRPVGWGAVVLGTLALLSLAFSSISIGWPLIFLTIGIVLVLAAYLIPRYPIHQSLKKLMTTPENTLYGLGLPRTGHPGSR